MPSASHDELPEQEIVPGYSARFADWGGITVGFEKAVVDPESFVAVTSTRSSQPYTSAVTRYRAAVAPEMVKQNPVFGSHFFHW